MAYRVLDWRVKVAVQIGGGNTSAQLLTQGDIVPAGVSEKDLAWLLKRRMIEEIPDAPVVEESLEAPSEESVLFDPLSHKVGEVVEHLKASDDEEIARVIEVEKGADTPRTTITEFTK